MQKHRISCIDHATALKPRVTAPSAAAFLAGTPCTYIGNTVTKMICQGLCLLQKCSHLCSVLFVLHPSKGSFWDLPQRWDPTALKTKSVLVYPERRVLSSGPSLHRSNVANLGLLLMIPDERGTIFGYKYPFPATQQFRTTPWKRT